ncbi:MAG: hypothetical protein IKL67_06200 [Tidjanibacter sp.]|nr:hypothetical protein [Tidjanibacter sp.]
MISRFGRNILLRILLIGALAVAAPSLAVAQTNAPTEQTGDQKQTEEKNKKKRKKKEVVAIADFTQGFEIKSGLRQVPIVRTPQQDSLEAADLSRLIDSLIVARESLVQDDTTAVATMQLRIDSLTTRRNALLPKVADSLATDSTALALADSLAADTLKKERYNRIFRDSLSFSLVTAVSAVVPGFAQLYEENYWKIPLEYAAIGVPLVAGINQNKIYRRYKAEYDVLKANPNTTQADRTPVQTKMLKHQSYRTMLWGAAIASYMGFLVDGVMNYPSDLSHIQKATTLSLVCPGAGQIYNGSYWKLPIVVAGMASMVYVIDWNQRGYDRFKTAYDLATDGDDNTVGEFPNTSEESLRSIKNAYRRNRDLAIIGTVAVYLVQVADAHIDAHMQAYDISDDLSMEIRPQLTQTAGPNGITNNLGFNMSINF